jgi:hypothetical protein
MKINKFIIPMIMTALFVISTGMAAFGLEVAVDEIRTKPVAFVNFQGPYERMDSIRDIEAIGKRLGLRAKNNQTVGFYLKYSIIRAISKEEPDKFSADIFSIDKDAKVGHIDVVRRITSAYLRTRYGYSRRDAHTLSVFLSYYNATYRENLKYFSSKYKSVVLRHIDEHNAGISTKYWEWPGATKMLIPLTEMAQRGRLDSVQPDVIADKKTIEQVHRDEKNIPLRKDMAGIKERILDRDRKELEREKAGLVKEKKEIKEEKKPVEKKKEEITRKELELAKKKEKTKQIAEPAARREKEKEIEKSAEKLAAEKTTANKKEEEIKKREETATKEEKKIAGLEKSLAARQRSLEEEKRQIARDEIKRDIKKKPDMAKKKLEEKAKELDRREDMLRAKELDKKIYGDKLYYLKIKEYLEGGHYNNDMYMINASTRRIMFKSPVEHICGSRYDVFSGGVVVITHRGSHTSGHRLTLIDRDTLKAKAYGNDDIFWRSFIEIRDGYIYAITYDKGKHYLGRFDAGLKLVAKSKEEVNENTFISIWGNYIYINRLDKAIMVLNSDDLSLLDVVKP